LPTENIIEVEIFNKRDFGLPKRGKSMHNVVENWTKIKKYLRMYRCKWQRKKLVVR